jgi:UDP-N-acetylglucosamine 2-epimerase (non-hydrolysing)
VLPVQNTVRKADVDPVKHIELVIGTRPEMVQALPLVRAGVAAAGSGTAAFSLVTVSQHTDPIMSTEVLPAHLTQNWPTVEVLALPFSLATALSATQAHFATSRPDAVIVIGDTDTSLAAALAATELRIPVAHVESGLRSHDWAMKEERNRVLIDHLSTVMFPPTTAATDRLRAEGVHGRIVQSGDVHVDAFRILEEEGLLETSGSSVASTEPFLLSTIHRRENILEAAPLRRMVELLTSLEMNVHLALHPHTRMRLEQYGLFNRLVTEGNVTIGEPLAFLDFVRALKQCSGVITDSGGVQKQAWMLEKPCITLRSSTEWIETLDGGWNQLIDPSTVTRLTAPTVTERTDARPTPFGDGFAAERIIAATLETCS